MYEIHMKTATGNYSADEITFVDQIADYVTAISIREALYRLGYTNVWVEETRDPEEDAAQAQAYIAERTGPAANAGLI